MKSSASELGLIFFQNQINSQEIKFNTDIFSSLPLEEVARQHRSTMASREITIYFFVGCVGFVILMILCFICCFVCQRSIISKSDLKTCCGYEEDEIERYRRLQQQLAEGERQ